jgi:hypothetical protein
MCFTVNANPNNNNHGPGLIDNACLPELTTHNVNEFLNLAYSFGTDLTHFEGYERAKFITLRK